MIGYTAPVSVLQFAEVCFGLKGRFSTGETFGMAGLHTVWRGLGLSSLPANKHDTAYLGVALQVLEVDLTVHE